MRLKKKKAVVKKKVKKTLKKAKKKKNKVKKTLKKATKKKVKKLKKKLKKVAKKKTVKKAKKKKQVKKKLVRKSTKGKKTAKKAAKASGTKKPLKKTVKKKIKKKALSKKTKKIAAPKKKKTVKKELKEEVSEKKFYSSSVEKREHPFDPFETPIEPPGAYLKDRSVLLVIDPKFVYVYWELKAETFEMGKNSIGQDSELVLRIYDVTALDTFNGENAHHSWDIPIHSTCGAWYVRLEHADKTLVLDVGLKNSSGLFYTLLRSNYASVPRNNMAKTDKIYWMTVSPEGNAVITEVEDFTDDDLELMKKIMGEELYMRLLKGRLTEYLGSSQARELFYEMTVTSTGSGVNREEKIEVSDLINLQGN